MRGYAYECIAWLSQQDQQKRFEVKEVRKRRSMTQNAYYWAMLNKLASALGMPDSEVHLNMLREYGTYEVFSIRKDVPTSSYFKYYDVIGTGTYNGDEYEHIRAYKGSSQMDSKEFSRLIDGMREECVLQGIDVMTPQEIAALRFVEPEP